ncbi:D-alanyl-D-alanine carboxypeptidase [Mesorhizobium sp. Root157]|uniref:D-alanyl-D-alanine carboxypeptidase n=1 Tax=Mesorhizobium sp. Root157 TaxID=1736477 RepID=UPI0006FB693D|nr:D-alanyl-D-alanine carboxypeptidase [Mesorhizobium sp. Root157]KQZ99780.1 D-alanyl-D-alanine carboxypeptidase [Mesorhizobium sp. Root157]
MRKALSGIFSKSAWSFRTLATAAMAATFVLTAANVSYAARDAAIVVDANTGKTLYASNANARRYPASLTKMMTLYLTFEALAKGKITKSTQVPFSANASAEPPTKLGVRKGSSVSVETAILSMVTKSANDSSTAMAEMLGGSEANFAQMMTAKARALGMNGTVFRNAHGLPNPGQFTTARDMATLGIALREHYPQYYDYFSQRSFMYGRQRINGHNRLLGRIKGVDGIKTGYTRASGFNLVSSVAVDGRRLVAVVMGGTSGASRDNQMAKLINAYLPKASKRGGGDLIAKIDDNSPVRALAKVILPKRDAPTPDSRPDAGEVVVASAAPALVAAPEPKKAVAAAASEPADIPFAQAYVEPETAHAVDPVKTASLPSGWVVQVASSPSKSDAEAVLDKTTRQARTVLADASGFTMPFSKGGVTYFRARFSGFDNQTAALKACNALKKKRIECFAIEQ